MHSLSEENYLKAIFHTSLKDNDAVNTNALAEQLGHKAPTVTDMVKKLAGKDLIIYEKYRGVMLTNKGNTEALKIVRKHRLWEVFLVEKLGIGWHEVHDIAEQLEHIQSDILVERLDRLLGYPQFDPHGDPIPNANGVLPQISSIPLNECELNVPLVFTGIGDHSTAFLTHLDKIGLTIGKSIVIESIEEYDKSCTILLDNQVQMKLSFQVSKNIFCTKR